VTMPARPALMGIDLGTTAVKVGLFDAATGEALAVTRIEYKPASPAPGWLELDAETYWEATVAAARDALQEAGRTEVVAIGLSSQGQTFVPLDRDYVPLRPAIVWLDTRAEEETKYLQSVFPQADSPLSSGLPSPNAIASAPKMLWVRQNEPDVWERTRYLMMLPDYLGFRLTGERRLDVNNAGSTAMVHPTTGDWWPEALAAVGVPEEWMSPIGRPAEIIGTVHAEAAAELSVPEGIPVALGSNDQLNGAVGVGNIRPGIASGTVGTAMAIVSSVDKPRADRPKGLGLGPHPVPGLFYLLSFAKTSGMVLTWLRDLMASAGGYEELLAEAAEVGPGSDGLVCLPHFSGTATPTFRSDVRGGFVGLTLGHGRAHLVRAIVEAVCFAARDAISLNAQAGQAPTELRMLGGATQSDFWMQMMSDVVRLSLQVPVCGEAPVLGAAIFAGVAAGRFASIEEGSEAFYRPDRTFLPREEVASQYDDGYRAYRETMDRLYPGALGFS